MLVDAYLPKSDSISSAIFTWQTVSSTLKGLKDANMIRLMMQRNDKGT